ncbi:ferritin-like domain-containing protein [Thermodesulforhabdus norvegica]|uniref:Rubrerythrin n=1 Tax=Thermodesulforhabdus norvegica TaxID=39841 RepID=A0A1I4UCF1_9BACT|nr:ferritin family protein [Thermodesulforhabdus norvegica]SFM86677.1 Rubrerythrin [Thermodesulforhabdus norvegica]
MIFGFNAEEVFDIAIAIEENGKRFYDEACRIVDDEAVRTLFRELAQEEVKHKERFIELKNQIPEDVKGQTVYDPDHEITLYLKMMADDHVFRTGESVAEKVASIKSPEDALKMAMQFEKDSVIFFLTMKDHTEDPKGKEMVDLLVKEEQQHLRRISAALRALKQKP